MKTKSFAEYLNSRGETDEKAKTDDVGDQVDMPTPKAKEDPHKKNKKKNKQPQVSEYLNSNGKLVEKPVIDAVADYPGPDPHTPVGNPAPYKASSGGPTKYTGTTDGLGDKGYKELKYNPDTEKEKVVSSWPKTKTEQFLDVTKDLSLSEFTNFVIESLTTDTAGKTSPHPSMVIHYIATACAEQPRIIESLVHEMKNQGLLKNLLEQILDHPDAYEELTDLLGENTRGPGRCRALVRAMHEQYTESIAPPIGIEKDDEDEDEEFDELNPDKLADLDNEDEDEDEDEDELGDEEIEDELEDDDLDAEDLDPEDEELDDLGDEEEDEDEEEGAFPNLARAMKRYFSKY